MKSIVLFFFIIILCIQCSVGKNSIFWEVKDMKTCYVQKGINDKYELPIQLMGKTITIQDSLLTIREISQNYIGSALNDEFGDTLTLERRILFKRQKGDESSVIYPCDGFEWCLLNENDTCFASEALFKLLEAKGEVLNAYLSSSARQSKTRCVLFILKENQEAVLYSENDFLLLFLARIH